jgi:uncharacterized protein (DUF2147 family)
MTTSVARGRLLRRLLPLLLLLHAFRAAAADAPPADTVIGDWLVDSHDAIIHIDGVGAGPLRRYVGHIAWLKDGRYLPEDGPALEGKPLMDLNNPDPALRSQPLLGLRLLWDLRYEDDQWIGGRVYDSDNGHTFDCTVQMADGNHLKLHAYIMHLTLLGGSTTWTRTRLPTPDMPAATPAAR